MNPKIGGVYRCALPKNLQSTFKITTRHPFVGKYDQSIRIAWIDGESFLRFPECTAFIVEFVKYRCLQSKNFRILVVAFVVGIY